MKRLLFSFLALLLVGCSSFRSERIPCPKAAILAEFSKAVEFQKGIPIRSEMDSLLPKCVQKGDQIAMDMQLRVTSLRSLPNFHNVLKLKPSFFVAVVDKTGNVLSRSNHDLEVDFEEKQTTKVNFIQIQETVPAEKDLALYIGFNVDEAQLEFLEKEREKKLHDQGP